MGPSSLSVLLFLQCLSTTFLGSAPSSSSIRCLLPAGFCRLAEEEREGKAKKKNLLFSLPRRWRNEEGAFPPPCSSLVPPPLQAREGRGGEALLPRLDRKGKKSGSPFSPFSSTPAGEGRKEGRRGKASSYGSEASLPPPSSLPRPPPPPPPPRQPSPFSPRSQERKERRGRPLVRRSGAPPSLPPPIPPVCMMRPPRTTRL